MTFEAFAQAIEQQLNQELQDHFLQNGMVPPGRAVKQADRIRIPFPADPSGKSVCIEYPLDPLYRQFGQLPESEAVRQACREIQGNLQGREMDRYRQMLSELPDYDRIQNQLFLYLAGKSRNRSKLQHGMYRPVSGAEDLCVFAAVGRLGEGETSGFVSVTDHLVKTWDISRTEIWKTAEENTIRKYPMKKFLLADMLGEEPGIPSDKRMQVVTNTSGQFGSVALFYPGVLKELEEEMGNFYILPSSVHELILLSESYGSNAKELEAMVRDINRNVVAENEVLSDQVYHYDRNTKRLERGVDYEQREKKQNLQGIKKTEKRPGL